MTLVLPEWAVVTPRRAEHIARVATLMDSWAVARGASAPERERWRRAAWLHDALKDASPDVLARFAPQGEWPLALWHGPAAAAAAEHHGETDTGVLNAIRYHTTGFAGWDDVGFALYLGDYLEPGRTQDRAHRSAWAARVARDMTDVLREVAAARFARLVATRKAIPRETWEFWNRHAATG